MSIKFKLSLNVNLEVYPLPLKSDLHFNGKFYSAGIEIPAEEIKKAFNSYQDTEDQIFVDFFNDKILAWNSEEEDCEEIADIHQENVGYSAR